MKVGNRRLLVILCALAVCLVLSSCGSKKPAKIDVWKLTSTNPAEEYGTYLGNGFISTQIKGEGTGSDKGKPLVCYMAGLYINEKLTAMPTWSDLQFFMGNSQFKLDPKASYKQILDMKAGILTTEGTWTSSGKNLKGSIQIIISRDKPGIALMKADFTPDFDGQVSVQHLITNASGFKLLPAKSPDPSIPVYSWELTGTTGDRNIACATYIGTGDAPTPSKVGENTSSIDISAKRDTAFTTSLWISWSRSASAQAAATKSIVELKKALPAGKPETQSASDLIASHTTAWTKLWDGDIVISGDPKIQQAMHSCMFYLFQSVREGSENSIPPMGLSNNSFNGHIFWDADTWMFPALILQHPELAKSIVDYRFKTLPGALKNAAGAGMKGAQYAWESGETGIEDAPTGIVYVNERHINSDVALAQWQYYLATADKAWLKTRGYPVISATADYWASKAKLVNGRYEIQDVVPPDENAGLVNNSVYTNAGAKLNLLLAIKAAQTIGKTPNPTWQKIANAMYIPFDAVGKKFIARDAYTSQKLKQADPELVVYPLQMFPSGADEAAVAKSTYDFYVPKVNANGPAMSSSVHSLIAARLGNSEESFTKLKASYTPFLRGSFKYFNEKRSKTYKNACFLTGASGPIQALVFGITGSRMDYLAANADKRPLDFKPCLPKAWKSVEVKGIHWQGKLFDVKIDSTGKATISDK